MKMKWMAVVALCGGMAGTMLGSPLVYTWTLPGVGSLDGVNFSVPNPNSSFQLPNITFTTLADSASVIQKGPGFFQVSGPTTVTVAGVGTDTVSDTINIFENSGFQTSFGLNDLTTGSGFSIFTSVGGCFPCTPFDDLMAPYGPRGGRGTQAGGSFNTTKGSLVFSAPNYYSYTSPTFQISAGTTAVTPEPSSLVLLGSGLVGLVGVLRRRRAL